MKDITKHVKLQRFVYQFARVLVGWAFSLSANAHYKRKKIKSKTFLVLCNHTLDIDPIYLIICLKKHARFVATSNIMEGFWGWFVKTLAGPIPRVRGASADSTVEAIRENLIAGVSVAMFPEGTRTWDGETGYISKRTATLLKGTNCGLVTVRATGGYLTKPRWAKTRRFGRFDMEVVNEYMPQDLEKMSLDEINNIINRDLYVDVFASQAEKNIAYRGKKLAEGIHMVNYICPKCKKIGETWSAGDEFGCSCGLKARYLPNGSFEIEEGMPVNTLEWDRFQKKYLSENVDQLKNSTDKPIVSDDNLELRIVGADGMEKAHYQSVNIALFGNRMEVYTDRETLKFGWDEINKVGLFQSSRLFFSTPDSHYRFLSHGRISGIKYYALWRVLTDREYV